MNVPADMPPPVTRQLVHVWDRLVRDHAGADHTAIDDLVHEATSALVPATVLEFLPLLVERRVREQLRRSDAPV